MTIRWRVSCPGPTVVQSGRVWSAFRRLVRDIRQNRERRFLGTLSMFPPVPFCTFLLPPHLFVLLFLSSVSLAGTALSSLSFVCSSHLANYLPGKIVYLEGQLGDVGSFTLLTNSSLNFQILVSSLLKTCIGKISFPPPLSGPHGF